MEQFLERRRRPACHDGLNQCVSRMACPGVVCIQSFACERRGDLGVVYLAANLQFIGSHKTTFYELGRESYHAMPLTAHKKGGQRGIYLRANLHRAVKHTLRQYRYIYFLKSDWQTCLKRKPMPYPNARPKRSRGLCGPCSL